MSDFACRCGSIYCNAAPMDTKFLVALEVLREVFNRPMSISSGSRCALWNAHEGGRPHSEHLVGQAADVFSPDGIYARALVSHALALGFSIGVGKNFIHIDMRELPPVLFGY